MYFRRTLLLSALCAIPLSLVTQASADEPEPLRVVATFSILGDMVSRIGGEHVALTTLVGPGGDAHVYQPTPADARVMSRADVLVVNGLDFEGWLDRLVDASEFDGTRIVATAAIEPLAFEEGHDHGAFDPHAWQSLNHAVAYVDAITAGLSAAHPESASAFYANRAMYIAEIEALTAEIGVLMGAIPSYSELRLT